MEHMYVQRYWRTYISTYKHESRLSLASIWARVATPKMGSQHQQKQTLLIWLLKAWNTTKKRLRWSRHCQPQYTSFSCRSKNPYSNRLTPFWFSFTSPLCKSLAFLAYETCQAGFPIPAGNAPLVLLYDALNIATTLSISIEKLIQGNPSDILVGH